MLLLPPPPILALNATPLAREPWPPVPWTYPLPPPSTITFERYGRPVCAGDVYCEERVRDGIATAMDLVHRDYVEGPGVADVFASGGVAFGFRQEEVPVARALVEEVVAVLKWVMLRCGTREVVGAALVRGTVVVGRFEVVFPGFEV